MDNRIAELVARIRSMEEEPEVQLAQARLLVTVYQAICFPVYGIAKARRKSGMTILTPA